MAKPCPLRLHFATFCGDYKRFVVAKVGIFWGSTKPTTTFPTRFTLIPFYHLQMQLAKAQKDYERLKTARMLEVTDGDVESAQRRLQKLIRDVNKCITLLSEQL